MLVPGLLTPRASAFFEGHLEYEDLDGLLGHDAGHAHDSLLLLSHLGGVGRCQQVQLVPPALERGWADVHLLADLGGRVAFTQTSFGWYFYAILEVFWCFWVGLQTPPENCIQLDQKAGLSHYGWSTLVPALSFGNRFFFRSNSRLRSLGVGLK